MILCLLRYLKGYVKISVKGFSPERFMNLCTNQNLLLWKVKKTADGYEMYMSIKGFFSLQPITRKTGTKVCVLKKYGFPFLMHRYRRYRVFQSGLLLCAVLLWIASCFIWEIELSGNYMVTDDNLYDFLKEQEIVTGIRKNKIDCEEIEKQIRSAYPQITWVSARLDGIRLRIEVNENTLLLSMKDREAETNTNSPCNLVSQYDGVVKQMITRNGTPLVFQGTQVAKGDILVKGEMELKNDAGEVAGVNYVAADADIFIETVISYQNVKKRTYVKKTYTGEEAKAMEYRFGNRIIATPVFHRYESFDRIMEFEKQPLAALLQKNLWHAGILYRESVFREAYYTETETKELLLTEFNKFVEELEEKGVQIIENNVTIKIVETAGYAKGTLRILVKNDGKQEIQ